MTSLAKIKQSLKSINMTLLVLNMIGLFFTVIGLVFVFIGSRTQFSQEELAALEAQGVSLSLDELNAVFSPASIVLMVIPAVLLLVVTILLLLNQGHIKIDQPRLLPYYGGMGLIVFDIFSGLIQSFGINPISLGLNGILFALYGTGFYLTKQFNDLKA